MWRRWWQAGTTGRSLSLTAWLLLTPVGVLAAPLAAAPAPTSLGDLARWLLIGAAAQIPVGLVMLVGGWFLHWLRRPRVVVVVTVLSAGAVRGLTLVLLGHAHDPVIRTLASSVTMSVWLLVIGAALEARAQYRRDVDELLATLVARELHGRLLDRQSLRPSETTAARIAMTSSELRTIVEQGSHDHARTAILLQQAIEERLRPLSHDLWFSPWPVAPVAHRRMDFVNRCLAAKLPVTAMTFAAVLLLSWGSVVLHGRWQGAVVGLVIAITYGAVLAVGQRPALPVWVSVTIRYLGVLALPAAAASAAITVLGLGQPLSPLAVALGLPLITFGIAAAVTVESDRAATLADLRARLAEPDWDRHLGELVRRELDANTATLLHNSVQSALTAAALQLQLAVALDEPGRARTALSRAAQAIDDVEQTSRVAEPKGVGRESLNEVVQAWEGIATVHVEVSVGSLDPREWSLLVDLLNECVANAVRHSGARSISASIQINSHEVSLLVIDDGRLVDGDVATGLGTRWMNMVTHANTIAIDERGQRNHVLVVPRNGGVTH